MEQARKRPRGRAVRLAQDAILLLPTEPRVVQSRGSSITLKEKKREMSIRMARRIKTRWVKENRGNWSPLANRGKLAEDHYLRIKKKLELDRGSTKQSKSFSQGGRKTRNRFKERS